MRTCTRLFLALCLLIPAACATTGAGLSDTVSPIRACAQQAKEQSAVSFNRTNDLALEHNVKRIFELPAQNLIEADFPRPVSFEQQTAWSNAFGAIDSYLHEVQKLVDRVRASTTTTNLDELAQQIPQLKLPGAAVAAFNTFAGKLVQVHAERRALTIMSRTDRAFNEVMLGMAESIGTDDREGLRLTVRSYWGSILADLRADYVTAIQQNRSESEVREIIRNFVATMDARDAQLRDLASMQSSWLALGQAHTAAARGEPGDAQFWIQRISGWLDEAKERAEAAAKKEEEAAEEAKEGEPQ